MEPRSHLPDSVSRYNTEVRYEDYKHLNFDAGLLKKVCEVMTQIRTTLIKKTTTHPDINELDHLQFLKNVSEINKMRQRILLRKFSSFFKMKHEQVPYVFDVATRIHWFMPMFSDDEFLKFLKCSGKQILKFGIGNCDELSLLAVWLLKQSIPELNIKLFKINDIDHYVFVVNAISDDCTNWDESVLICDPLFGKIFAGCDWMKLDGYVNLSTKVKCNNNIVKLNKSNYLIPHRQVNQIMIFGFPAENDHIEPMLDNTTDRRYKFLLQICRTLVADGLKYYYFEEDHLKLFISRPHIFVDIFYRTKIYKIMEYGLLDLEFLSTLNDDEIRAEMIQYEEFVNKQKQFLTSSSTKKI